MCPPSPRDCLPQSSRYRLRLIDFPGTQLKCVPDSDEREDLRGQASVHATKDFAAWDIIGAYSGRLMTELEHVHSNSSFLVKQKTDDYIFQLTTKVVVEGQEQRLVISPYPFYGNESMAINDGAIDKKKVNVGWMEVLSDGWPYVFVVALRGGVKKRQELLLDYSSTRYWEARDQSAFEDAGPLKALRDPALVRARERLAQMRRASD